MVELNTFAVAVYSENGVAEACLSLQDEYQVDVPLLLFCGWYGAFYGRLPAALLTQASEISRQLGTHLIKPLRQARRWMKTHSVDMGAEQRWSHLREEIKRAELEAEMLMLDSLAIMVSGAPGSVPDSSTTDAGQQQHDIIMHNMRMLFDAEDTTPDVPLLSLISAACLSTAQSS